jgi:hypothetical protein
LPPRSVAIDASDKEAGPQVRKKQRAAEKKSRGASNWVFGLTEQEGMNTEKPTREAFQPTKKPRTSLRAAAPRKQGVAPPDGASERARPNDGAALALGRAGSSEGAASFARLEAEIVAVLRESVRPINVHVPSAAVLVLGTLPGLLALRDEILETCPCRPPEVIDKLRDYALAAAHAHARVLPYDGGETRVRTLLNEALPLRERLLASAEALVAFGLLDAGAVASIRRGTGHLDTAQDLLSLGEIFRRAGPALVAKTPLDAADVERASHLGDLLLEAIGQKRQGTDGSNDRGEAEEQLAQAFELLRRAYEECRRAVSYLRWHEGDADAIAPPLAHSRRRGRRLVDGPGTEPDEDETPQG